MQLCLKRARSSLFGLVHESVFLLLCLVSLLRLRSKFYGKKEDQRFLLRLEKEQLMMWS